MRKKCVMGTLTEKQNQYCIYRAKGYSRAESARRAGYSYDGGNSSVFAQIGQMLETRKPNCEIVKAAIEAYKLGNAFKAQDISISFKEMLEEVITDKPERALKVYSYQTKAGSVESTVYIDQKVLATMSEKEKAVLYNGLGSRGTYKFLENRILAYKLYRELCADELNTDTDAESERVSNLFAKAGLSVDTLDKGTDILAEDIIDKDAKDTASLRGKADELRRLGATEEEIETILARESANELMRSL